MTDKVAEAMRDEALVFALACTIADNCDKLATGQARAALACPALHAAIVGLLTEAEQERTAVVADEDVANASPAVLRSMVHFWRTYWDRRGKEYEAVIGELRQSLSAAEQQRQREVEQARADGYNAGLRAGKRQEGAYD